MKTISPWFRTAKLINGIRRAYCEGDATRTVHAVRLRQGYASKRHGASIDSAKNSGTDC